MVRRFAFWLAIAAAWTFLVIVFAASSSLTYALTYQPPRWRYTLMMAATEWYVWAAFTPLIAWLSRRFRISRQHWWRVLIFAAAGLAAAFFKVTLTRVLRGPIGGDSYFQITNLVSHYLIFWGLVGLAHAWFYHRRAQQRELRTAQLETLLAQTRLQMLSMQLQPHFLFNTLNTIAELVHHEPATAERMIGGLSHLLRETLQAGGVERVPLDHELRLLDRYVDIQRARFGDRLTVTLSIDESARRATVPGLLLQPLVENAIKHGIGARSGAGSIVITAARQGDRLVIEISDDGSGLRGETVVEGVGLGNCRARLAALFGSDAAGLTIANRDDRGAVVRLTMPFQAAA
jgi:two-component system, LytTR family, sensor kinase